MNSIKNSHWLDSPKLEWQHHNENHPQAWWEQRGVSGCNCWGIGSRMRHHVPRSGRSLFGHEQYIMIKYQRRRCRHDNGRSASVGSGWACDGCSRPQTPLPRRTDSGLPRRVESTNSGADGAETAVVIGVLLAVASGMRKRGGDKEARFPDGLGAILGVKGAV